MTSTIPSAEKLYTVDELAARLNFSRRTVIRLIENEPGVLILETSPERRRKLGRRYRTFRVPEHVVNRITHKLARH